VKNDYGTEKEAWDLKGLEEPLKKKCQDITLAKEKVGEGRTDKGWRNHYIMFQCPHFERT
jgi:hypothetical protein